VVFGMSVLEVDQEVYLRPYRALSQSRTVLDEQRRGQFKLVNVKGVAALNVKGEKKAVLVGGGMFLTDHRLGIYTNYFFPDPTGLGVHNSITITSRDAGFGLTTIGTYWSPTNAIKGSLEDNFRPPRTSYTWPVSRTTRSPQKTISRSTSIRSAIPTVRWGQTSTASGNRFQLQPWVSRERTSSLTNKHPVWASSHL